MSTVPDDHGRPPESSIEWINDHPTCLELRWPRTCVRHTARTIAILPFCQAKQHHFDHLAFANLTLEMVSIAFQTTRNTKLRLPGHRSQCNKEIIAAWIYTCLCYETIIGWYISARSPEIISVIGICYNIQCPKASYSVEQPYILEHGLQLGYIPASAKKRI